jgi:hypothetical protein
MQGKEVARLSGESGHDMSFLMQLLSKISIRPSASKCRCMGRAE